MLNEAQVLALKGYKARRDILKVALEQLTSGECRTHRNIGNGQEDTTQADIDITTANIAELDRYISLGSAVPHGVS